MAVSERDVIELRRAGQAQGVDVSSYVLRTTAELVGYMVAEARAWELGEAESHNRIELVLRAAEVDRQDVRAARDALRALNYSPDLIRMLTRLSARARPKPTWMPPGAWRS